MIDEPGPGERPEMVELIRSIDVAAPERLHERVAAMTAAQASAPPARRPHLRVGLALSAVGAALIAIVASLALSGSNARPTLAEASALTLRAAMLPAPGSRPGSRLQLSADVEGVAFPDWAGRFGWSAQGMREDRIGARAVETVFYADGRGHRLGYAILAGAPAPAVSGGSVQWRHGEAYRLSSVGGVEVVSWERRGRLCVMSGRGVGASTLLALASWDEGGRAA